MNHAPIYLLLISFVIGCGMAGGFMAKEPSGIERLGKVDSAAQEPQIKPADLTEKAPDVFRAVFSTTKGDFTMEFYRDWSPNGVDRIYNLIKAGYYTDIAIFRAIDGFMFQFGIHGDPAMNKVWSEAKIKDDPPAGKSNTAGTISFAMAGPNTRTVQLFINFGDNSRLDSMGFTPLGKVVENANVLGKINTEYGENSREVQGEFQAKGNEYIKKKYPNLDYIKSIKLVEQTAEKSGGE